MKTKEEKSKKRTKTSIFYNSSFFKTNWVLLVLFCLAIIVVFSLLYIALVPYFNKKNLEKDIANKQTTYLFSIDKIVCYSSAYGINNEDTQGRWNLNLSQYTDIAIYLNSEIEISSMYIDNISFSNNDTGSLSLSYLNVEDFSKSPIYNNDISDIGKIADTSDIDDTNITNLVEAPERIDLDLVTPITLRYLNQNLKENCIITDTKTPLIFDGSILKRGKVILSSLKNTISFNLHIINNSNQEYTYPISVSINLENKETSESIYNGYYLETIT